MPSALVEKDGTLSLGYSYDAPYGSVWVSSTILPFLQVTARYVSINGIPGFSNEAGQYGAEYGRYKDKVFSAKLRLWEENGWLPGVALGAADLQGTGIFKGKYVVATKTFGATKNIEISAGVGHQRPAGMFVGARWVPANAPNWAAVAEYDANDYPHDFRAADTFAGQRRKGPVVGLEYRWGWIGAQIARHRDHVSANAYVTIPLSEREFLPKLKEPVAFQQKDAPPRASLADWQRDGRAGAALVQTLARQDFQHIRVELDNGVLKPYRYTHLFSLIKSMTCGRLHWVSPVRGMTGKSVRLMQNTRVLPNF